VTQALRHPLDLVRILLSRPLLTTVGALLVVAANGCVVPIGPEFRDPQEKLPPEPFKPTFTSADPPFGTTVGLDGAARKYFTVTVDDINVTDQISVRWVLNYPPYNMTATKQLSETKAPSNHTGPLIFGLYCKDVDDYKLADRNLVVIASDNGFTKEGDAVDRMLPLSYDASGVLITVVGSWRLSGCQ